MKKLMIICMLAAIGAVGMISKSNAENGNQNCAALGNCDTHLPPSVSGGIGGNAQPPVWQGGQNWGNGGNNWRHRGNWNRGADIGIGIYSGPTYYNDPYAYDDSYDDDYAPPPVYRSYSGGGSRCSAWAQRLNGLGYRNVRATDCSGTSYVYRATKAGRPVKVTVSASSGSVIRVANTY